MSDFFQPNPVVLALFSLQTFFYLPLLLALGLCRSGAARGASRWFGVLSVAIALTGIAAHFGPPFFKLYTGPLPQFASLATKAAGGMALPLAASAPLTLSAFLQERRWKWVDWAHGLLFVALIGLWGWTRIF